MIHIGIIVKCSVIKITNQPITEIIIYRLVK